MPRVILKSDGSLKARIFSSTLYLYCTISAQHLPSTFDDRVINAVSLDTMSDVVQLSADVPAQSISEVLGPGIVGLFVQGLEIGLILSQFSQWLYLGRREGVAITLLVLFVTTVGLSAFASPGPFSHPTNLWFWGLYM